MTTFSKVLPESAVFNQGADNKIDIGFLEVRNDQQLKSLGRSFIPLGQIALSDLVTGDPHHFVGYPVDEWFPMGDTTVLKKIGFYSTYQEKEWEYLLFSFPKKDEWYVRAGDGFEKSKFVEKPDGFSGGGVWAFNPIGEGEMFVPEKHTKLRGIQSAWWFDRRLLKCVPIQRWLELVHEAYTDLRPTLEAKWPALAKTANSSGAIQP
jgi:hypothetical protein